VTSKSFRVNILDEQLDDLRARIENTNWPPAITAAGWDYGTDDDYLQDLADYWLRGFDWRSQEAALNAWPQVRCDVGGLGVHALHVPGSGPSPLPLVMTHGWPSSIVEWRDVIGPLTDPAAYGGDPADAFTVVAPSLPGYGFSEIPTSRGMSPRRIATMWVDLMASLGYERFGAHGCDWGSYVTALLGLDHPDHVVGAHMGMVSLGANSADLPAIAHDEGYSRRVRQWRDREQGYVAIQSTKPQTLAYGLTDSPVGLAAWIAEKWSAWTDCGGDLDSVISRDVLLTNIAIYWFTGTINSANRLYKESRDDPVRLMPGQRVQVPCGFLLETSPEERGEVLTSTAAAPRIGTPPRARVEAAFNISRWTPVARGGHFPALEIPAVFVDELRAFFRPLRNQMQEVAT
jgi:pimeloyl-ACP methyl ester carboxylesterase